MQLLRKYASGLVLLAVIGFAAAITHPQPAHGASAELVRVVNTPLPVSGDVNITGTPPVNAKQSGPWTVGLNPGTTVGLAPGTTFGFSGPVTIDSSITNPVIVRDLSTANVLQLTVQSVTDGAIPTITPIITVPAGKTLVVEHLSADMQLPAGHTPSRLSVGAFATTQDYLVPQQIGGDGQASFFSANHSTRLYFFGGEVVNMIFGPGGVATPSTSNRANVTLSGYLTPTF